MLFSQGSDDPRDGSADLRPCLLASMRASAGECGVEALIGLNDRPSGSQMKGGGGVFRGPGSRGSYDTLEDGRCARLMTFVM